MLEIGERPWGKYFVLADEPHYKLKRIEVNPGQKLSYQYHHKDRNNGRSLKVMLQLYLMTKKSNCHTEKVFLFH